MLLHRELNKEINETERLFNRFEKLPDSPKKAAIRKELDLLVKTLDQKVRLQLLKDKLDKIEHGGK